MWSSIVPFCFISACDNSSLFYVYECWDRYCASSNVMSTQEEPADCKWFMAVNHLLAGSLTHCYQLYVKEVVYNGFHEVSTGELHSYFEHWPTLHFT